MCSLIRKERKGKDGNNKLNSNTLTGSIETANISYGYHLWNRKMNKIKAWK
jgi:hypothetical protein